MCVHSRQVHECMQNCREWVETSEGRVCKLTGIVVGKLDDQHYATMPKTTCNGIQARPGSTQHWAPARTKTKSMRQENINRSIRKIVFDVLFSQERKDIYENAKARVLREVAQAASNASVPPTPNYLYTLCNDVIARHKNALAPPAAPPEHLYETILRTVCPFYKTVFKKPGTQKDYVVFTACILYHMSTRTGLVVEGKTFVPPIRFCQQHCPNLLQFGSVPGVRCRDMANVMRRMKAALLTRDAMPRMVGLMDPVDDLLHRRRRSKKF